LGAATRPPLKALYWVAGILLAAYVVAGVYLAGGADVTVPQSTSPVIFTEGKALGHRLKGRSWTAQYDRIVSSPDQTRLELDGVHDTVIFKDDKPYLSVRARHMTVNTVTHDFRATGAIHIETIDPKRKQTFDTDSATWADAAQHLALPHEVTVGTGAERPLHVGSVQLDVKSGDIQLRNVSGGVQFK
jgi:hypothetical protein